MTISVGQQWTEDASTKATVSAISSGRIIRCARFFRPAVREVLTKPGMMLETLMPNSRTSSNRR